MGVTLHSNPVQTNLISEEANPGGGVFVFDRSTNLIERLNLNDIGITGDMLDGNSPAISDDGRFVAFSSSSRNLITNDTNGFPDIFVHDRNLKKTERVSLSSAGIEANGASGLPYIRSISISKSGRLVAFSSDANNLVANDLNGVEDVFVFDRATKSIERISVSDSGIEGNGISRYPSIGGDERHIAFQSIANNLVSGDLNSATDIFIFDRTLRKTERVSVDNAGQESFRFHHSTSPSFSADGRFVAFESEASNFVTGDNNAHRDIFVYDRLARAVELISINDLGLQANNNSSLPTISADGRFVTFQSDASNLSPSDFNENSISLSTIELLRRQQELT